MPKPVTITRDEWLDAYAAAQGDVAPFDPDALTVNELAAKWQCGERHARRIINQLVKEGKVTRHRKMVRDVSGRFYSAPAYKLKS